MKVLHVVALMGRDAGGPARSIQGLVAALCKRGVDAWVWPLDGTEPWLPGVRKVEVIAPPRTVAASATGADQRVGSPHSASFARGIRYHASLGDRDGTVEGYAITSTLKQSNNRTIRTIEQFDLVHIHGVWSWGLHRVAVMCRKVGVPYIIAPRGMLEPWSLRQKGLKKRIARWLYQDRDLRCAAALHATAESEAEQFRRLGFKNKIIVAPNGVNVPEGEVEKKCGGGQRKDLAIKKVEEWLEGVDEVSFGVALDKLVVEKARFEASTKRGQKKPPQLVSLAEAVRTVVSHQTATGTYPSDKNILPNHCSLRNGLHRALFVSRMHPKKGVLELVESWARVKKEVERRGGGGQWCVELVYTVNGADEKAYEQKVKDRILALGMTYSEGDNSTVDLDLRPRPDFLFTGPLDDNSKWSAYARADLFVLPTYSENFGIVVAEALWAGVPVITTKGTPWSELEGKVQSNNRTIEQSNNSRCGWWIEIGVEPLVDALLEAIEQSNSPNNRTILQEMGARGHQLVAERYTWAAVCDKMLRGYEDVLG